MTPPSVAIPPLLRGLVDDAAVFPPGNAALPDALSGHRAHRASWFEDLVGPLLLPVGKLGALSGADAPLRLGLIADSGPAAVGPAIAALPEGVVAHHVEARAADAAALDALAESANDWGLPTFAEIPVTDPAPLLDRLADGGLTPKFRTGGLAPELFPGPETLAAAIGGCVTDMLATTESAPLLDRVRDALPLRRPAWVGFGSCSITEPLDDLIDLSLVRKEN
jgi:hypothetical protein